MTNTDAGRWWESLKAQELRDALNWRGIPEAAEGATLATQQGTRGSPIVDAACVPGLELYKVSPLQGTGFIANSQSPLANSGDYMWASAGNLDLSFLMWNDPGRSGAATNNSLRCGIMLRGDILAATQLDDVFGAAPAEMVLVSGTHAWRVRFNSAPLLREGGTRTGSNGSFNGWDSRIANVEAGSQFTEDTPLPFLVYEFFTDSGRLQTSNAVSSGGTDLLSAMRANYATFRIYDFTLYTPAAPPAQGVTPIPARMPPSMSGRNTNAELVPNPANPAQTIQNQYYWYVPDATIAPRSPRSISAQPTWDSDHTVAVNSQFSIRNLANSAFQVTAGESFSIGIAPGAAQIQGASYTYDRDTDVFSFIATAPNISRLVFTGALTAEPGKRAQVPLTITVTS